MNRLTRQDEGAPGFRWWFRPAVALIDFTVRIKSASWQTALLAFVVKHGIKPKAGAK